MDWLQGIEPGLAYVTVREQDVVLLHREAGPADSVAAAAEPAGEPIVISPKKLHSGTNIISVIAFSRQLNAAAGVERTLQVALKKEVVEREQAGATTAIQALFNLSLLIITVSFGISLLMIIWLVQREITWGKRQRQHEHLMFAGAVASSIIHDFRNPMSAMQLDAQLLQQEAARDTSGRSARLQELAARLNATFGRLDILLAEFRLVAKPEAIERERFEINATLQDCLDLIKLRLARAGLAVRTDLSAEPLGVIGFPVQFKRALLNILNNAEVFSPPGGRVTIRTHAAAGQAILEITDEGPGIAPQFRQRIFDLFYTNRPAGIGIGLALAKTAVENCGGTISVQAGAGGRGSCFIIRLPLLATGAEGQA
ncbi:MAG: HAMP domain-containing histidine kinase [Lentisphaerae bacterium]|nr:HAMP domain-containing histidine kinase [Lentisphaerota bacterium]